MEPERWEAPACGLPGGGSTGALKARPARWEGSQEPVREAEQCPEVASPLADTAPAALPARPCGSPRPPLLPVTLMVWWSCAERWPGPS